MTNQNQYRTALVTGASRGIGAAIVERLGERNMTVHAVARSREQLDSLAGRTGCRPVELDVTDDAAIGRALDGLEIDVLINNAGTLSAVKPFAELASEERDRIIDTNLRGALAVTRAVLPGMLRRKKGHIFFLGSLFGPNPAPNVAVYAGAKAALRAFCACLRLELVGTGIRVTEVAPGRVETTLFSEPMGGDLDMVHERMFKNYRSLQPDDVAQTVVAALDLNERADATLIEVAPTDQAFGGAVFAEKTDGT